MNILTLAETLQEGRTARQVDTGREVIKIKQGSLVWKECRNTVQLTGKTLHSEFEIVPEYVSFGEAMEANRTGKVFFHGINGDAEPLECNISNLHIRRMGSLQIEKYSLHSLVEGKWTIEEDSQ